MKYKSCLLNHVVNIILKTKIRFCRFKNVIKYIHFAQVDYVRQT